MNRIQKISLMLQLGLDPATERTNEELRALWRQAAEQKAQARKPGPRDRDGGAPSRRAA